MRILSLFLLPLLLAGCATSPSSTNTRLSVPLYKNAKELAGRPYQEVGDVSGSVCRNTIQDPPADLASARRQMQSRAARLNADAVLLHDCQIINGMSGCYQQAVCQGSALNMSSQ